MRLIFLTTLSASLVLAQGLHSTHLFRAGGSLTEAKPGEPRDIAAEFLGTVAAERNLDAAAVTAAELIKEYRTAHNGVTHLVYRQRFGGLDVTNGEWTVNVDREGRVINAGGLLFPEPARGTVPPAPFSVTRAARAAVASVNPALAERFRPALLAPSIVNGASGRSITVQRLAGGELGADIEARPVWFGTASGVVGAWEFYVLDADGVNAYNVIVDSLNQKILEKESLTRFQAPRGLVFERQSPQPNPQPGFRVESTPAYVPRTLQSLAGDSVASPRGWVTGEETAGNNVIAGSNALGTAFGTARTARSASRDFQFPLELGPGAPNPNNFADAASVNLFYWMNRAHDLFYQFGFDEAAGNYQVDNFNKGGAGGDPVVAFAHYGSAGPFFASLNNAFYSTRRTGEDGSPAMIAMYLGTGADVITDGSYDAEVMVHEYTHGVSTRLVRRLIGHHGGSMGEAWSDFFSLEFTVPDGAPPDGVYGPAEYLFQVFGPGLRSRPYSTDMNVNPVTFAEIGKVITVPEVHSDGMVWVEALWEMRANLIQQFGEREGRRRARLLVIDGMKLSPPSPTMVDARDAILLADRTGFNGASQQQIWAAFAKRGLGALAHAQSVNSVHVATSFDMPSPLASMRFYEPEFVNGETVRVVFQDANEVRPTVNIQLTSTSGDAESIVLQRQGSIYTGSIPAGPTTVTRNNGVLTSTVGDVLKATYLDPNTGGVAARQVEASATTRPAYVFLQGAPAPLQFPGETPLGFRGTFGALRRFDLPFEFPYFGKKYSSLRIFPNGLLTFDLPVVTPCTDGAALASFNAIAPMWMEMTTLGRAQAGEDVYVSRPTQDSIAFRWAGSTDPGFGTPEAVNFATILYADGRIEFRYGSGNKNLAVDNPAAGCPVSTPTIGISNGNEVFTQLSTLRGRGNLENAPTVTLLPGDGAGEPAVTITRPDGGQTFQGVLNGRAVVSDPAVPLLRVEVYIDGVYRANAVRQAVRPAECGAIRAGDCAEYQFNLDLDALAIAPGRHTVRLRAVNARAGYRDNPESPLSFNVEAGQTLLPTAVIEAPTNGAEVSGLLRVRGYAYGERLRVSFVEVLIDGLTANRAALTARPDICNALDPRPPNCPNIGFDIPVSTTGSTPPIPDGKRKLQIRIVDESGRITLYPETPLEINVNNGANQLPKGALVTPSQNEHVKGSINIWGYAWDPDGRVALAQLLVDGEVRATIPYGETRPGECAVLTGIGACPNIGFALDFDTRKLRNGPVVLGVRVIDNRGGVTVLPSPSPNVSGITVFVEN
ncbi:MAG: M36 family metallopeptidase [Bryobacteraceae bacterium]